MRKKKIIEALQNRVTFLKEENEKLRITQKANEAAVKELDDLYTAVIGGVLKACGKDSVEVKTSDVNDILVNDILGGKKTVTITSNEDSYTITCE